ncbi:hypothetical protein I4U23_010696 [Adineta vaga]|nr:hypothetical protein I4U23_010696 [Adineta vaga]
MSIQSMNGNARIFNPLEASKYLEKLESDKKLGTLIRYNHKFDWSKNEGLEENEVKIMANRCQSKELKGLYESALKTLTNNDQSTLLVNDGNNNDMSQSNRLRKSYVLYAERKNDKFNIVAASAIQTKEFDWEKIKTMGLTSLLGFTAIGTGIGAAIGSFAGPAGTLAGSVVGGSIGGAVSASGMVGKVYSDYQQQMPEAVYAYIFQELQEKHLLQINDNKFAFEHNQN